MGTPEEQKRITLSQEAYLELLARCLDVEEQLKANEVHIQQLKARLLREISKKVEFQNELEKLRASLRIRPIKRQTETVNTNGL